MDARRSHLFPGVAALLLACFLALAQAGSPLAWHGSTEIARGNGVQGPWQQSESRYDYVDDPTVAIDPDGNIAVAWVDQARKAVLFQRFSRDGRKQFEPPVDVSGHPDTFSWLPRIAFAPDAPKMVFVLWQEIIFSGGSHGGEILFARSQDGGRSFSAAINLSKSTGGDGKGRINRTIWHNGSLDLVAGADGVLFAAWTEYDGPLWFSRSTDGGRTFSRPRRLAGGGNAPAARAPSLALGPNGTVYLAWTVGDDPAADIHLAQSTDGGDTFSDPRTVAPSKGHSDAPKLAVDAGGMVHLVYAESSGGPFDRYRVRYTRSADGGRTFEMPRDISEAMEQSAAYPCLGVDAKGRLVVIWEMYPDYRQLPRGLGLAFSGDGGRSFSPPSAVPASLDAMGSFNGSRQGLLMKKLAVNGAGAVAIVNSSMQRGHHSRVWMIRAQIGPEPTR